MDHLTVDQMIRFVSMTELNTEAVELAATVNRHIRGCKECLMRVRAFQTINDEFAELCEQGDFRIDAQSEERELFAELEYNLGQEKHPL